MDVIAGRMINQLDTTGNTMSAVVKGFASGSAGFVSFGLYGAIMLSANISLINIYDINSIIFLLLGGLFTYAIQALCMYATCFNAEHLINESRKQISSNKDITNSFVNSSKVVKPDYFECIQMSANIAFKYTTIITWIVNIFVLIFSAF